VPPEERRRNPASSCAGGCQKTVAAQTPKPRKHRQDLDQIPRRSTIRVSMAVLSVHRRWFTPAGQTMR
jgi:hypothetical protein